MNDGKFRLALVKMSNNEPIPEDEPIFILRARDIHALPALRWYQNICRLCGSNDYQTDMLAAAIERFEKWANEHPEGMKEPGVTRGL